MTGTSRYDTQAEAAPLGAADRPQQAASVSAVLNRLKPGPGIFLPAALLAAWWALSALGVFAPNLVPSPAAVVGEVQRLLANGTLFDHIAITTTRVILGFAAGAAAATALGALTGYSRLLRDLLDPMLQALKSVPSLAWVPLFILWFGIFETSKIALIAVGAFFPIYLNVMSGIQSVDRKLVEVARINGLSELQLIRRVLLPATLPSYFIGLRAGLALGWMFVIAAELMGASEGLGFLMVDGQMTGRPALIVASLILFAIAGKLTDAVLAGTSNRLMGWQDSFSTMEGQKNA